MRNNYLSLVLVLAANDVMATGSDIACNGESKSTYEVSEFNSNKVFDPPPGNGATPIDVGFHLMSLSDIDVIGSRFRFEGFAQFSWCDSRLAFDEDAEGRSTRLFFGDPARDAGKTMWIPDIAIANSIGTASSTARRMAIDSDGSVRISGIFSSTVAARYDLRRFPFDRQSLVVALESFSFNRDVVLLRPNLEIVGFEEDLYLPEWRVKSVSLESEEEGQVRDSVPFSRVVFRANIQRETGYYLFKLSVPLILIVMLSWSVFWMRTESLGGRMRISSTAFLTIVAYQFAVSGSLPKVAYLTFMDKLMVASFILIALTALENMVAVLMIERNPDGARRLDVNSRWIFPLGYLVTIATVALVAS